MFVVKQKEKLKKNRSLKFFVFDIFWSKKKLFIIITNIFHVMQNCFEYNIEKIIFFCDRVECRLELKKSIV